MFPKRFFFIEWGCVPIQARASAKRLPPIQVKKKLFGNILSVKIHFVKKSRNLSWVGAGFSFQWLNFSKNAWNFALTEIWSGCRCDMKIIFHVFDNLDAKLLSNKIFWCWHAWSFDSGSVYFVSECQGLSKRLGCKRCCDTKPDRCLECCRLTILNLIF